MNRMNNKNLDSWGDEKWDEDEKKTDNADENKTEFDNLVDNNYEKNTMKTFSCFDDIDGMDERILRGIYAYGFDKPAMIQSKAILPIMSGGDIIAQSQSGTGKTGAFVIGTLNRIDSELHECQAIILSPTRELASQIHHVTEALSDFNNDINSVLCIGGTNIHESKYKLKNGAQIVIGTPGRVVKMIEDHMISTRNIKILILDEADELLSHSFIPQIKEVIQSTPEDCQICLFSATMPKETLDVTKRFLKNPEMILVKSENLTLEGIQQFYIDVDKEEWKFETLCDLYNLIAISQSIIYVNTKNRADWLSEMLIEKNFTVGVIHSSLEPVDRVKIMEGFRHGTIRILISTDLLARGIDVQNVRTVLNYDIPNNREAYIHRIGRSGRFGKKGIAINFTTRRDFRQLKDIEQFYGTDITSMPENIGDYINS